METTEDTFHHWKDDSIWFCKSIAKIYWRGWTCVRVQLTSMSWVILLDCCLKVDNSFSFSSSWTLYLSRAILSSVSSSARWSASWSRCSLSLRSLSRSPRRSEMAVVNSCFSDKATSIWDLHNYQNYESDSYSFLIDLLFLDHRSSTNNELGNWPIKIPAKTCFFSGKD